MGRGPKPTEAPKASDDAVSAAARWPLGQILGPWRSAYNAATPATVIFGMHRSS
jgi:hypothetical protein